MMHEHEVYMLEEGGMGNLVGKEGKISRFESGRREDGRREKKGMGYIYSVACWKAVG